MFVYFTITLVSTIPISAEVCYWLLWCWGFLDGVLFGVFFVVLGGLFSVWCFFGFFFLMLIFLGL